MLTRKLLDLNTASIPVDLSKDLSPLKTHEGSFDPNLVVILAALLCALVCALAINYIIRWAFQCGRLLSGRHRRSAAAEAEGPPPQLAAPPVVKNLGLKQAAVQTLPTITYTKPPDAELDCPICLTDFADGEKVSVLPKCNHSFHRQCIDKWLLDHSSCPTCRENLVDVLPEKKTVAAMLCRYQHSHANISIIIHHNQQHQDQDQDQDQDSAGQTSQMDPQSLDRVQEGSRA